MCVSRNANIILALQASDMTISDLLHVHPTSN